MKSAVAWNVKGVGLDARETAREAARRAGLSVGEWLNSIIESAADTAPHLGQDEEFDSEDFATIRQHLDALAARLGMMGSASKADHAPRGSEINLRALEKWLADATDDLARRGPENPQRVAQAIDRLNERLDQLLAGRRGASESEHRAAGIKARNALNGETLHAEAVRPRRQHGADDAVSEIRTRQRALEDAFARGESKDNLAISRPGMRAAASELEQQLRTLSRQLDTMRRPCTFEDSVAALRRDLGNIGDALAKAMPRCALDAMESEVQSLVHRAGRGHHRPADQPGLAAIEQRLEKLHDVLAGLTPAENVGGLEAAVKTLSRKVDVLASSGPDPAALQHLETAIAELRGLAERVASGEALTTLGREVRTLAERMHRLAESDPRTTVSALEQRIEALSETINARTAEAGKAVAARLEPLIAALLAQLDRLDAGHDQTALDQIARQITRLAEKIEASDARLGNIDMIERGLADLSFQLEETRANAVEASEFKRDLADLRLTQTEVERRTQQTLERVQHTIDRLADRLALMETEAHPDPSPRPAIPPIAAAGRAMTQAAPPRASAHRPEDANPASSPVKSPPPPRAAAMPAAAPPRAPIDPSLPGDHPLEPGSAGPRGRAATPAERIAASEGALAGVRANISPETGDKADFIAAARRAAQAAAAEAAQPRREKGNDPGSDGDQAEATGGKLKRSLFLSVAAAILIVGATHVALTVLGSSNGNRVDQPRHAATDLVPPVREAAKPATAITPSTPTREGAKSAAAPGADGQLMAPPPVANAAVAPPAVPPAPAGRPEAKPATGTSPFDLAALNSRTVDVTGSLTKSDIGASTAPVTIAPAMPAHPADNLPAAIAGPSLRAAAAAGNAAAEYEIAVRYAEGRGVAQNLSEAARWFERAAAQGVVPAQYRLGSFYEKGHGVKKDIEAARRLYVAAAEKGSARAMHNLAVLHAEGIDGKPDYKTAFHWFRKAAGYAVADSQYNLGILYARGIGVEQNLAESYKWFALAAQQGDQDAARKRDDVAGRLDPQSLVAAKLAAQTFTPEPQPEAAISVKSPADGWDRPAAAAPTATPAKPKGTPRRT